MINREQAAQIAVEKLKLHPKECGYLIVGRVVSIDEITGARPCAYIVGNESMEDCWIIYFDRGHFVGLGSSTIMLISRKTGAEVYFGSANDEGYGKLAIRKRTNPWPVTRKATVALQ